MQDTIQISFFVLGQVIKDKWGSRYVAKQARHFVELGMFSKV